MWCRGPDLATGEGRCWGAAGAVVAAAVVVLVVVSVTKNRGSHISQADATSLNNPPPTVAVRADTQPHWPAPADAAAAVRAAGLPMLAAMARRNQARASPPNTTFRPATEPASRS
jgi:hypothetical protein